MAGNAATATFAGRSLLWSRMRGTGTEPKYIKWGDSAVTASANADVALFRPSPLEEPVTSEPVSETEFPASWENTGNSDRLGLASAAKVPNLAV